MVCRKDMASNTTHLVIWEWEFSYGLWLPYEPEAVLLIENARRSNRKRIKLNGRLASYEVDLRTETQIRTDTGTLRQVRRSVYPTASLPGGGSVLWEWESDFGWLPYDLKTASILESAHKKKITSVNLSRTDLNIPNTVDLSQRQQINHHSCVSRRVRRTSLHRSYPQDNNGGSNSSSSLATQPSTGGSGQNPSLHGNSPISATSSSSPANSAFTTASASSPPGRPLSGDQLGATGTSSSQTSKKKKRIKKEHKNESRNPLSKFCSRVQAPSDEECPICFDKLSAPSNFDDDTDGGDSPHDIKQLDKCRHLFHSLCLTAMYNSGPKDGSLQCPVCKVIHGVKCGTQPSTGTMHVVKSSRDSLPGHPGCGIITITYNFKQGMQGNEHPSPGKPFWTKGFPRVCYLPDNTKGKKVLQLLKTAWDRRLVFTIATSNTTGQKDTVVWNEIHHKTEAFSNHSGHGYPDPNYLDNVLAELASQGVEADS